MAVSQDNADQLKQYRSKAAEVGELREQLGNRLQESGDIRPLQQLFQEFSFRTQELEALSKALGPSGIFLAKYGVQVINDHRVSFVIPKGVSRFAILKEAQELVRERDLIRPAYLHQWEVLPGFNAIASQSEAICIDGLVAGSHAKNFSEQQELLSKRGLLIARQEDLAVAFAVFWVASGESLLGWHDHLSSFKVRTKGSSLWFSILGLEPAYTGHSSNENNVAVAARWLTT